MRSIDTSRKPDQWLRSQGVPAEKIAEILRTFLGAASVCTYSAPHLFLRAHGKATRCPIFRPNYWADGSVIASALARAAQFEGHLADDEISRIAKNYYRDITAISHNWNDLASNDFWRISLRAGETVEGLQGPVAPQPAIAENRRTGEPASRSLLAGGGLQVFLNPKTPFLCIPVDW